MDYILQTFDLKKKYKNHFAVDGANMNICRGDIYGFVGENGSGKTTIIRLITGLVRPYSGSFKIFGVDNTSPDVNKVRAKIGAIVESPSIYYNMSAYENLKMQSLLFGVTDEDKICTVLNEVGLSELYRNKKHVGDFSLGMRQRLGIAMALLGNPEFIILDEPMNGLDPAGIVEIRELILKLNREKNITFLISSHILTELSLVATKYGIISKGRIVKEISAAQLHSECGKITFLRVDNTEKLGDVLKNFDSLDFSYTPEGVKINGEVDLNELLDAVIKAEIKIISINCNETSIEDYYLSVVENYRMNNTAGGAEN